MAAVAVDHHRPLTSATAVLSLLVEPSRQLQVFALQKLNSVVDLYWPEIADSLTEIEKLYEDDTFSHQDLAALVASKVYYHLEEYSEALRYGLGAGKLFDLTEKSQYVNTIISKCIDEYVRKRDEQYEQQSKRKGDDLFGATPSPVNFTEVKIDPRLEIIFEHMVDACRKDGEEKQALGVAIDSRRLDKVEEIILSSADLSAMLLHCLKNCQMMITSKRFRSEVIDLLIKIYRQFPEHQLEHQYPYLCQCLFHRDDSDSVADILIKLLRKQESLSTLMAYQIGFDIVDLENQSFLRDLLAHPGLQPVVEADPADADSGGANEKKKEQEDEELQPLLNKDSSRNDGSGPKSEPTDGRAGQEQQAEKQLRLLRYILSGKASIELELQFLHRNNHSDLFLLDQIRNAVDQRNSITHHAIVIAHGLMQAGTTNDAFLRPNLDWFGKAVNWAKFSAAASLGVIHKGHINESKNVLGSYLPGAAGERGSPYSEGGALYAMGLINANHSDDSVKEYLLTQLKAANNDETLQHGACLGLGLLCMGQNDDALYDDLKGVMFMDSAVAGEAAGYAIGLLMLGTASPKATSELLSYAHDTQHEKIIRACSVAVGMVMYRREEEADSLIEQLSIDKDALIRYGAMYCIGLAYCGTSKNSAIRRLLHVSVSDVSDDVRRAAVIAIGFVLCNSPEQVPKILNLLAESYNPHVRYAAALAIGVSCAGTAMSEAIRLLMPMTSDSTDFVRQGALIGLGLVLQQTSEIMTAEVKTVRETIFKVLSDKHEDVMTRFGAILASGLLDAGGRNCAASFFSKTGNLRQEAAVGFTLFTQLWYWFPLIHCISLAFEATALIGLNADLKMPANFELTCSAKPELFAYPPPTPQEKKEEKKGTMHAVLSTAAKRQALKAKKKRENEESMQIDQMSKSTNVNTEGVDVKAASSGSSASGTAELGVVKAENMSSTSDALKDSMNSAVKLEELKTSEIGSSKHVAQQKREVLKSPCRVVPKQECFIEFFKDARYLPVFPGRKSGFLILNDTTPSLPEELVEPKKSPGEEREPDAPEPFEWSG